MAVKPEAVTEKTFEADVLKSGTPVLVDFWATWCGPCRMVAPIMEQIAGQYAGKVKVTKLDVDANQKTALRLWWSADMLPDLLVERGLGVRPHHGVHVGPVLEE